MQPHREAIRRRDVEKPIHEQVRRIKRGDMAFGYEWNAEPKSFAPERQLARGKAARELGLDRAIEPVRVTAHRFVPDE